MNGSTTPFHAVRGLVQSGAGVATGYPITRDGRLALYRCAPRQLPPELAGVETGTPGPVLPAEGAQALVAGDHGQAKTLFMQGFFRAVGL